MEIEAKVVTKDPTTVLEELKTQSEFDDVNAEQTGSDAAFAGPEFTEMIIEILSEPENIEILFQLIKECKDIIISGEIDEEVDPEEFIISNTNSKKENIELVQQEIQDGMKRYEYYDSFRGVKFTVEIPEQGKLSFEMQKEENNVSH